MPFIFKRSWTAMAIVLLLPQVGLAVDWDISYLDGSALPSAPWEGGSASIIDITPTNQGLRIVDNNSGVSNYWLQTNYTSTTVSMRFAVESFSGDVGIMMLITGTSQRTPGVGLMIHENDFKLVLLFDREEQFTNPAQMLLQNFATPVLSEFYEATIHINDTDNLVRFWWNHVLLYEASQPDAVLQWDQSGGWLEFGASFFQMPNGTGRSTIIFDWLGYGTGSLGDPLVAPLIGEVTPDPLWLEVGTPFRLQMSLLQASPPPTWSIDQGPTGVQISSTGLLSGWTPSTLNPGSVAFDIVATNSQGLDHETFTVRVFFRADFDADGDVDHSDFGQFQACLTGPGVPQTDPACLGAHLDADEDVDHDDFGIFQRCMSGPNIPADPNCAD